MRKQRTHKSQVSDPEDSDAEFPIDNLDIVDQEGEAQLITTAARLGLSKLQVDQLRHKHSRLMQAERQLELVLNPNMLASQSQFSLKKPTTEYDSMDHSSPKIREIKPKRNIYHKPARSHH